MDNYSFTSSFLTYLREIPGSLSTLCNQQDHRRIYFKDGALLKMQMIIAFNNKRTKNLGE